MEVDHSGVRMPAGDQPLHGVVVERRVDVEEAPELVVRADVVAGEDVQPAEAAQQHVFGGPATDAAQARQALDRRRVVESFEGLQIEIAGDDRPSGLDDRARLGSAEAVALELVRPHGCELIRAGERAGPPGRRTPLARGRR